MPKGIYQHRGHPISTEARKKISISSTNPSKDTRLKMRNAKLGKKHTKEQCDKISSSNKLSWINNTKRISIIKNVGHRNKGRIFTKEHRDKLSKAKEGMYIGDKNPAWKGGVTCQTLLIRRGTKMEHWRKAVFERDDFACQSCGKRGGQYLQAHHIKSFKDYPELRFAIDNGMTLCIKCHRKINKEMPLFAIRVQ